MLSENYRQYNKNHVLYNVVIIQPQVQPIRANKSEINDSNRVGQTETSTDDDDYYDYYNNLVSKGGDYEEDEVRDEKWVFDGD